MLDRGSSLMDIVSTMPDPRHRRGRVYALGSILGMLRAASTCGYPTYGAMAEWCRRYGAEYAERLESPAARSATTASRTTSRDVPTGFVSARRC